VPLTMHGQKEKKRKSRKSQQEQVGKKETDRSQKEGQLIKHREHHLEIQDKKVRKRMKRNERQRRRTMEGKSEPFYKRWFKRKKRWK